MTNLPTDADDAALRRQRREDTPCGSIWMCLILLVGAELATASTGGLSGGGLMWGIPFRYNEFTDWVLEENVHLKNISNINFQDWNLTGAFLPLAQYLGSVWLSLLFSLAWTTVSVILLTIITLYDQLKFIIWFTILFSLGLDVGAPTFLTPRLLRIIIPGLLNLWCVACSAGATAAGAAGDGSREPQ